MEKQILRKIELAFIRIHILHHAKEEAFFGLWIIKELQEHGYDISEGTLYPILHKMKDNGLLEIEKKTVNGKIRKYYSITKKGENILRKAKDKTEELFEEIF